MKDKLKLYLVTDRSLSRGRSLSQIISAAAAGGVTMVQLREKDITTNEFVALAKSVKECLKPLNIPLIINDRIDVALAVDADGVHIGQSDMPYEIARKLLGPDKIIGLSVENLNDLLVANDLDVDYVGISPVFATTTKTDTAAPFGIDGLKDAVRLSTHPTVAIGGMNRNTARDVMNTGCDGIAVVSAISAADDPTEAASELKTIVMSNARESWAQSAWQKSANIYRSILSHRFIKELADGSLDNSKFAGYIGQDEIYLRNYYAQMFMLADMMTSSNDKELFKSFAMSGMEGEKAMHDLLINKFNINTDVAASPVTRDYNNLICEGIATNNIAIALAAVLPCMWIYNQVGLHILKTADLNNNPYHEWITEYGNETFTQGVNQVLDMIDEAALNADAETKSLMNQYFLKAALYEYAFWDYGYYADTKSYDYTNSLDKWI